MCVLLDERWGFCSVRSVLLVVPATFVYPPPRVPIIYKINITVSLLFIVWIILSSPRLFSSFRDPLDDPFIGHTQTHPAAGGERTEVRCKRPIPGINDWIGGGWAGSSRSGGPSCVAKVSGSGGIVLVVSAVVNRGLWRISTSIVT